MARVGLNVGIVQLLSLRLDALFGRERRRPDSSRESIIALGPAELASFTGLGDEISLASRLIAASFSEQSTGVVIALVMTGRRQGLEIEAALRIASRAALLAVKGREYAQANAFWRERALAASEDRARQRQGSLQDAREREHLRTALETLARLPRRKRFQGFAEIAAQLGRSEAWELAVDEGDGLALKASFGLRAPRSLGLASALRASFERRATIIRRARDVGALFCGAKAAANRVEDAQDAPQAIGGAEREDADCSNVVEHVSRAYAEDSLLREHGFASYVAVPFARGVLMLASSRLAHTAVVRRVQDFIAAAQPVVKAWLLEDEVERYRALVRKLGLRLLSAADLERARIARDLHDDQAQLVATLKLALSAPKARAAKLITEIERELRARITALRPATLGRLSLRRAIERELERLKAAGIKTKLLSAISERGLSKPMRQICFQVVREALANVARHAAAAEVVVTLKRRNKALWLEIANDGVNPRRAFRGKGAGLAGLDERVALLGGTCRFTVGRGKSRLVAEIPCAG